MEAFPVADISNYSSSFFLVIFVKIVHLSIIFVNSSHLLLEKSATTETSTLNKAATMKLGNALFLGNSK